MYSTVHGCQSLDEFKFLTFYVYYCHHENYVNDTERYESLELQLLDLHVTLGFHHTTGLRVRLRT